MSTRLFSDDGFRILETADIPSDLVLINGLPDVGLVGLLAASHIVRALRLEEVGAIASVMLPPMIVLHGGVPKLPFGFSLILQLLYFYPKPPFPVHSFGR